MIDDQQIEKEFSNEITRKTFEAKGWHDRLPKIIERELNNRLNHWIGIARPKNIFTKETKEFLEELKSAIYLTTKKHFEDHDKDNTRG